MYDIIIKNGRVFDGAGNPWIRADIGISGGKIASVGKIKGELSKGIIDADGLAVSPGFIDITSNYEATLFEKEPDYSKLEQGITTAVTGNIGMSYVPMEGSNKELHDYLSFIFQNADIPVDWCSMEGFFSHVEKQQTAINMATMIGHGVTRIAVMGNSDGTPSYQEMEKMKSYIWDALSQGAYGMSSALALVPGLYSKTEEIIELSKIVEEQNGYCSCYIRSQGDNILNAVREIIEIGRRSGAPVNIAHIGVAGRDNWGKSAEVVRLLGEARNNGVDITADMYPYLASLYPLKLLLPPWAQSGSDESIIERLKDNENRLKIKRQINEGLPQWESFAKRAGWENVIISGSMNKAFEGKSLKEIAESIEKEPADAIMELIISGEAEASMVIFEMSEDDISLLMKQNYIMVASSSLPRFAKPHPRCYGTFPRLLGRYVRERGVLSLPDAIRKITSLPAKRIGLEDRGMIREGMWADIAIFDAHTIDELSNYVIPEMKPIGIKCVLVNGRIAVSEGCSTGCNGGRMLRRGRQ